MLSGENNFVDILINTCKILTDLHVPTKTVAEKMLWLEENFNKIMQLYHKNVMLRHDGDKEDRIFNIMLLTALGPNLFTSHDLEFIVAHIRSDIESDTDSDSDTDDSSHYYW